MFEKVLFATDFSEYAKKTLDCIAGFPGARDVILLHVIEEARSPRGGGEIGGALFRNGKNFLREEKRYLEALGQDLRVTTAVKSSSDTAGAILLAAEEHGVSLIVVGAHGKSLVGGVLLGSVSRAVLRRSRTSVLIMRYKIVGALKGMAYEMFCPMILSRVLCPVDFSRYSDHAVAIAGATRGMGEVILFHVVSRGETEIEIEEAVREAERQIGKIRRDLAAQGVRARTLVRTGNPSTEIVKAAEEEEVSVIWMSSHGKGWFAELLLGSTADTVAVNATRPVIIIRGQVPAGTG
jgi:nucleotide-binding universal stress UspA family protein